MRYPKKAPTATANITPPLYVMNSSLETDQLIALRWIASGHSHDEETVEDLDGIK